MKRREFSKRVALLGAGLSAGTTAALCAAKTCGTRDLAYSTLRDALLKAGVNLES